MVWLIKLHGFYGKPTGLHSGHLDYNPNYIIDSPSSEKPESDGKIVYRLLVQPLKGEILRLREVNCHLLSLIPIKPPHLQV